jgi:hypothetical protein
MTMRRPQFSLKSMLWLVVVVAAFFAGRKSERFLTEFLARSEIQIQDPWNHGNAFQVRLDIDRLRACGLSKEDVMRALTPNSFDPKASPRPPGVVFVTRLRKPDQYENIILKANPDGVVVRLKDVAKVELLAETQEVNHRRRLP